ARSGQDERAREALRRAQHCIETAEQSGDELAGPFTCGLDRASGGFWPETQLAPGAPRVPLEDAALMHVLDTTPEHRMRPLLARMNDVYTAAAKPEHRYEPIAKRIRDAAAAFRQDTAIRDTEETSS